MKRIKHNDLLPWFTQDHETLPASYLKSCREFFDWLDRCDREGFQAPSNKPQATSLTQSDYIDPLQKINRKELKKL